MNTTDTINGAKVIRRNHDERFTTDVVLLRRDHPRHPFVVAYHEPGESSWVHGRYFASMSDAVAEFKIKSLTN